MTKISKALVFTLLISLTFSNSLRADCPHCYIAAEVKLSLRDGEIKKGFIPIYGYYLNYGIEENLSAGDEIKKNLSKEVKEITFVPELYEFPKIGMVACKEDIQKIPINDIDKILFKSWERKRQGAGKIANLPRKDILNLKNKKILNIEVITESCYDVFYINQNPEISEREFKLLINYDPKKIKNQFDDIYRNVMYRKREKAKFDAPLSTNKILESMKSDKKQLKRELELFKSSPKNKYLAQYFDYITEVYNRKILFYTTIIDYIENKDRNILADLADKELKEDSLKISLREVIYKTNEKGNISEKKLEGFDNDKEISYNIRKFFWILRNWLSLNDAERLYEEAINKNEIIIYVFTWD